MEEYKSNSHKSRAEAAKQERKVEKVVTGTVKRRKKADYINLRTYLFLKMPVMLNLIFLWMYLCRLLRKQFQIS